MGGELPAENGVSFSLGKKVIAPTETLYVDVNLNTEYRKFNKTQLAQFRGNKLLHFNIMLSKPLY